MTYGKGVALVLGAGILWSTIGLVVRQIEEAGAASVMFWRSAGLLPVLWAFLHWRTGGRVLASMRAMGLPGLVGAMGLVAAYAGALYALQATTVANAVFLYSAAPFFAALRSFALIRQSQGGTGLASAQRPLRAVLAAASRIDFTSASSQL